MAKDMLYFEMKEVMQEDCCPICSLIAKGTEQMMDSFLYESVNDPSLRKRIRQDRGFCDVHARLLMEKGDPLAHALIYEMLLNDALRDVKKGHFEPYVQRKSCLFCRQEQRAEKTYLQAFASFFSEQEFRAQYEAGGLLCIRHLAALHELGPANEEQIRRMTGYKYEKLVEQLEEIRQKNDYRFSDVPWGPGVKTAWKRAVSVINGAKTGLKNG